MKKGLFTIILALCLLVPLSVFAKGEANATPVLSSVSFNNAVINEEFSENFFEYTITLDDPSVTPTLKSYKIEGSANIFVTYELDEAKHQKGIIITLEFENGSAIYNFRYSNAIDYEVNSNNLLSKVECRLGEVYPKINDSQTDYKLYIPSDLTEINLSAATEDIGAVCEIPKTISLAVDQEPDIAITVTASDGSTRIYNFEVKRLNKTCAEVQKEMESPDFDSLVKGELFYQKPNFILGIACAAAGIIMIILFINIAKRLTVKVEDENEETFFNIIN